MFPLCCFRSIQIRNYIMPTRSVTLRLLIKMTNTFLLDGETLTPEKLVELACDPNSRIDLTPSCWDKVQKSRKIIDDMVREGNKIVYGVNTGFGNFANKIIQKTELKHLQVNLIRSHSVGVGKPLEKEQVRMLLILRINTLARGRSGISAHNLQKYIDAFNAHFVGKIPCQGTVGASGDLAPLAHLALGMLGQGQAWSDQRGNFILAAEVLKEKNLKPIQLEEKEGLALINGTQMMSSITSQAFVGALSLVRSAQILAALSIEVFGVSRQCFHPAYIKRLKSKHLQQVLQRISHYFDHESELHMKRAEEFKNEPVPNSITQAINALATIYENLEFIQKVIVAEINGTTDNPLVFEKDRDQGFQEDTLVSAGNFHGEYIAKAADFLAMSIHTLGKYCQRRIEKYVNGFISKMPQFLCKRGREGLNSGFMISQCTSAALMSENKVLVKPASVDSIPTSASQQDHVSMGGFASRKCINLLQNVRNMMGIELMMACQAVDTIGAKASTKLMKVHSVIREQIPFIEDDVFLGQFIEKAASFMVKGLVSTL